MNVSLPALGWLGGSLVALVLLDWGLARLLLELLRPASAFAFWSGRAAKLLALLAWCLFFNGFWYPQFLGSPPPPLVTAAEGGVLGLLLILSFVTLPRAPRRPRDHHA
ncbi:MAG TPA: hypothetical protein VFU47_16160 [Armatimonadota bacterium]|nr:hypothetical protein [Armatimonadota bacterium]